MKAVVPVRQPCRASAVQRPPKKSETRLSRLERLRIPPKQNAAFVHALEKAFAVYHWPYDRRHPQLCLARRCWPIHTSPLPLAQEVPHLRGRSPRPRRGLRSSWTTSTLALSHVPMRHPIRKWHDRATSVCRSAPQRQTLDVAELSRNGPRHTATALPRAAHYERRRAARENRRFSSSRPPCTVRCRIAVADARRKPRRLSPSTP